MQDNTDQINLVKGRQLLMQNFVGYLSEKAKKGNKTIRIADIIEDIIIPENEYLRREFLILEANAINDLRELTGSRPEKK
ncbi:MAG: hypothetical protein ABIW84_10880 [Ilumatobacteraceae bacterium]